MTVDEALKTRRSIRKFTQEQISDDIMTSLIDVARYAPAAANIQPLKFAVINTKEVCDKIFPLTKWAKLLGEKGTPRSGEEPTAYIIVMTDKNTRFNLEADAALAIENIVISAWDKGIGSCILGSIDREKIAEIISMPENLEINYAVALGYPMQESYAEDANGNVAYYMDDEGTVRVPKRAVSEIMWRVK